MMSMDKKNSKEAIRDIVKCYYRNELLLEHPSCNCSFTKIYEESMKKAPSYIKDALKLCHEEVIAK